MRQDAGKNGAERLAYWEILAACSIPEATHGLRWLPETTPAFGRFRLPRSR